jgi:hypothetical protein
MRFVTVRYLSGVTARLPATTPVHGEPVGASRLPASPLAYPLAPAGTLGALQPIGRYQPDTAPAFTYFVASVHGWTPVEIL